MILKNDSKCNVMIIMPFRYSVDNVVVATTGGELLQKLRSLVANAPDGSTNVDGEVAVAWLVYRQSVKGKSGRGVVFINAERVNKYNGEIYANEIELEKLVDAFSTWNHYNNGWRILITKELINLLDEYSETYFYEFCEEHYSEIYFEHIW